MTKNFTLFYMTKNNLSDLKRVNFRYFGDLKVSGVKFRTEGLQKVEFK